MFMVDYLMKIPMVTEGKEGLNFWAPGDSRDSRPGGLPELELS